MRWLVGLAAFAGLLAGCGDDDGFDLATRDLTREGLLGADLGDVDLADTSWDELEWSTVDIESLVQALGLTVDDRGERSGLDEMIDSYSAHLGTDPELGTGEEDIVFWMMSVQLESLARALDVEGFDAFRADADSWPELLPDGSAQFRARMAGLVSKSFHLSLALSIETSD